MAMIKLRDWANAHGILEESARQKRKYGHFKSAKKIGRCWYIDENEILEDEQLADDCIRVDKGMIPLTKWAEKQGISSATARQKAARGNLKTAVRVGYQWFVNANEKNIDARRAHAPELNNGTKNDMGELIKLQRTEKGLTQMQLAELIGVNQSVVSSLEKGHKKISEELMSKLEEVLGLQNN